MVDITEFSILPLMYTARKYFLTGLIRECQKWLEKELDVNKVFTILEESMLSEENEIKQKCLNFITTNTRRVFDAEDFLRLSRIALEEIVSLESLAFVTEKEVYESCVKWAKHQLQELGNDNPSDEQIREKLGNILYNIQFPLMPLHDFAEITLHSTVLSAEEKLHIYEFIASGESSDVFQFATFRRRLLEIIEVNRHEGVNNSASFMCDGSTHTLSFMITTCLHLVGVGLYGAAVHGLQATSTNDVKLTVSKGNEILSKTVTTMTAHDRREQIIKIRLANGIHIRANTWYTVSYCLKGPPTWRGKGAKETYDIFTSAGPHRITFQRSANAMSGRQLPQLCFLG